MTKNYLFLLSYTTICIDIIVSSIKHVFLNTGTERRNTHTKNYNKHSLVTVSSEQKELGCAMLCHEMKKHICSVCVYIYKSVESNTLRYS